MHTLGLLITLFIFLPFWNLLSMFFIPFTIIIVLIFGFFVRSPIYTLLLVLFSFILSSILLINISSELLAYIFLIVYLGAVMMLFLFVTMLFNLQDLNNTKWSSWYQIIFYCLLVSSFFFELENFIIFTNKLNIFANSNIIDLTTFLFFNNVTTNSAVTFLILYKTEAVALFFFITLILIFSLISAISIALITKNNAYEKNSNYFNVQFNKLNSNNKIQNYKFLNRFFHTNNKAIISNRIKSISKISNAYKRPEWVKEFYYSKVVVFFRRIGFVSFISLWFFYGQKTYSVMLLENSFDNNDWLFFVLLFFMVLWGLISILYLSICCYFDLASGLKIIEGIYKNKFQERGGTFDAALIACVKFGGVFCKAVGIGVPMGYSVIQYHKNKYGVNSRHPLQNWASSFGEDGIGAKTELELSLARAAQQYVPDKCKNLLDENKQVNSEELTKIVSAEYSPAITLLFNAIRESTK